MSEKSQNIAVIGAGVMGLVAAYGLARVGHSVRVYDPHGFWARNASAVAGGMLAPYAEIEHLDARWVEAGFAGIEFWRSFADGADIGFGQAGSLLIAHEPDGYILARFREHLGRAAPEAGAMRCAAEVEPALGRKFEQGLYIEGEGHVHPAKAMAVLAERLRELGVECREEAAEPQGLAGVFDFVIDCRGMGAGDGDIRGVKGELAVVRNPEFTLSRPVRLMHPRYPLYIVPRADHVFMIGATQIESTGERVALRSAMELLSALYSLHPSFGEAEILGIESGVRPSYADNLPRVKVHGNVVRCNGLFRHGYLLSPVMAEIVAAHVAGGRHGFADLFMGEV
jgi:glycine oxidase